MLFFFNMTGAVCDIDIEGHELATMSDARIEAVRFASETLRDQPSVVWEGEELRIEVTNKHHRLLFTVVTLGVDAPHVADYC